MVLNSPDDVLPQVGPISLRIPLAVLTKAPQKIESIDATGLTWRVSEDELRIEANSIGAHAVIAIS